MKSASSLVFAFILLLFFPACECVGPCYSELTTFTIIEKSSGKDLVFGTTAVYKKDSIFGIRSNHPALLSLYPVSTDPNALALPYDADTVYLKLGSADFDTVVIKYTLSGKSHCCPQGIATVDFITYNGNLATRQGKKFLFEK